MPSQILYPGAPALTPICLGGSTFGRENDQATAFALMDYARAKGITLFDTAATYTAGASERIVGAWLADRRPKPGELIIATKIYPPYRPAEIDTNVAASAARLGVATIDLLYLHKWDEEAASPDALRALDRLVREGRVRALGASNFTAEQLHRTLELQARLGLAPFRILQNNNNLAVRDVDDALVELCARHGVAIVTYSPLGAGFLTGKHRGGVQPGSRFDVAPGHQAVYFNPVAEGRLARLTELAARSGHPQAHLALAWAMHRPGVSSVLVGGRTSAHLDQAFAAYALNDPALFAEITAS